MIKKTTFLLFFYLTAQVLRAQQADLVLTGGNIITLQTKGDRAEAVAIKDNLIVAVSKASDIKKYIGAKTKVIELNGQTVTPGFNDVHQHPSPVYSRASRRTGAGYRNFHEKPHRPVEKEGGHHPKRDDDTRRWL